MEKMKELIDTYLDKYDIYKNGKVTFDCEYGELIFYKEIPDCLTLHSIYFYPEYRRQGLCRNVLHYLIEKSSNKFKYLCVEAVLSKILHDYLIRFKYKNNQFKKVFDGFYYKMK